MQDNQGNIAYSGAAAFESRNGVMYTTIELKITMEEK